jgi:exo-1,4-beta-D-glucosaminidase
MRNDGGNRVAVRLHNPTSRVAFFERVELTSTRDGDEILPIEYSDNYVTVFPSETVDIQGDIPAGADAAWVRVTGYNSPATVVPID